MKVEENFSMPLFMKRFVVIIESLGLVSLQWKSLNFNEGLEGNKGFIQSWLLVVSSLKVVSVVALISMSSMSVSTNATSITMIVLVTTTISTG